MYGKPKGNSVPSDVQAREKLAMYVYEYLLHVGASNAASTFLKEIGWEKQIAIGDSPGFLHSWWCVFWDLYCASPERRETCEHSPEAKAFHDYSAATAPSPLSSMPPDGLGQPGIPPGYFPPGSAASPSPHHNPNNPMMRQPYISPRYGAPRPGMQGPGPQQLMQGMEHSRPGQMMGINRMVHPRNIPPGMNPSWGGPEQFQQFGGMGGIRMPASGMPGHGGIPMSMHGRSPWNNPSGPGIPSSVGPGTPVLRSPQGPRPHMHPPHRYPMPHDPKNPEGMNPDYSHMGKPMPHPQMPSSFPMVPDNNLPPTSNIPGGAVSTPNLPPQPLNGMNGGTDGNLIDGIPKNSPNMPMNSIGGPASMGPPGGPGGTPHTPQEGDQDSFSQLVQPFNDNNESAAILKIKQSMEMDAKMFEKDETREGGGAGGKGGAAGEFNFLS